jgi:peptidoglycan hydrolase-like protein with peptidoglycan-binding domain
MKVIMTVKRLTLPSLALFLSASISLSLSLIGYANPLDKVNTVDEGLFLEQPAVEPKVKQEPYYETGREPKTRVSIQAVERFPYIFTRDQTGPTVDYLQYRLAKLGYEIEASGMYDAETQAAVTAFQTEQGLKPTGWFGIYTLEALERAEKAVPPTEQAITVGIGVLQKGQVGEAVVSLQKQLQAAGYAVGTTGLFGEHTEQELKHWQEKLKLTPTGQWGKTTLKQVKAAEAEAEAHRLAALSESWDPSLGESLGERWDGTLGDESAHQNLGRIAQLTAEKYQSVGLCYHAVYEAVTQVYGDFLRGPSAYMAAEYLNADSRFENVAVPPEKLGLLPPGWIVVWGQSPASPHGHISVSLGHGLEASDHINQQLTHLRGYTNVQVFRPR